jgi:hypothetical protein
MKEKRWKVICIRKAGRKGRKELRDENIEEDIFPERLHTHLMKGGDGVSGRLYNK